MEAGGNVAGALDRRWLHEPTNHPWRPAESILRSIAVPRHPTVVARAAFPLRHPWA